MSTFFVEIFYILLIYIIICFVDGGVHPNYRASFEFLDHAQNLEKLKSTAKWWQTASFYQIYPRSFQDSNGDGVGDLIGITEKLPYLKEIGVTATWLSPIFTSPMADFGYDIANFTEIDPLFGTMEDFDNLIKRANEVGVKIILDFVPNHSSDECEWFKKSIAKDSYFKDFYVWHPGKMVDGIRHPPTNWVSVFHGPAWQWNDVRQEYYLHQFVKKQPDLNYRNPKVKETMNNILRFWLNKGVAGFRIDAVPHIYEIAADAQGNFPDEPTNSWVPDPDDYGHLQHIYTVDQPETIDLIYEWRGVLDEFHKGHDGDEPIMMTETYSPIDIVMKYYGNDTVNGAQIPFNFLLISWVTNDSDAFHYVETINTWLSKMPQGRTANWVIGNHDKSRVGSRLGKDRMDMLNMLTFTLPGCSVTYNGEEIGMTDVWISWNDTVDPSACNTNPDVYEKYTRDPARTPFQWSDEQNAGFSTGKKTWLPIASNYKEVNLKVQRIQDLSHVNIFKQLQELRKDPTMQFGETEVKAINNAIVGVKRFLVNSHTYVTLMNLFDNEQVLDLTKTFNDLPEDFEYTVVTAKSKARIGALVKSTEIHLGPKESVILRSQTNLSTTAGFAYYYETTNNI